MYKKNTKYTNIITQSGSEKRSTMSDRYSNVFALLQIISLFFITISTSSNNNVNKFIRLYKKKAKDNINNINSMIQYGEALMKIGKYEKAEKAFKRAYKLEPINLRVLENLDALVFNYNVDANSIEKHLERMNCET